MALVDRAGLTAGAVHRWLRGLRLFHATRFAVMAAVVGATVVSYYAHRQCRPEHLFCGPSPRSTWELALVCFSLVLLISAPGMGCLSALAVGVLAAGDQSTSIARNGWAAEAALSAAALLLLLVIRVHQHRVAATVGCPMALPGGRTANASTRDGLREQFMARDGLRARFIGVAAAVGIVLMIIYQYQTSASDEHRRHAVQTNAVVYSIDGENGTIDLYLPDTDRVVTVETPIANDYRADPTVPVMVDSTGGGTWLALVGQPDDQTLWLSFAILAWLLAAAAGFRPVRMWWAHRRAVDGDVRGVLVSTRWPHPYADAELSAADGSGACLTVLRSPVPARLIAERAKEWRRPELGLVTGQLWYGGMVRLHEKDGGAVADAIMGLPQYTLLRSWHAKPARSTLEDESFIFGGEPADSHGPVLIDGDELAFAPTPFTAHGRHQDRMGWMLWPLCVVVAVGTVAFFVANVLRNELDPWAGFFYTVAPPGLLLVWVVILLRELVHAHVAVSGDGVRVVTSWSTYRIPWGAIDKVELEPEQGTDHSQLVFTTPDEVIRAEAPVGLASPSGGMVALVNRIVDFRDRARPTGAWPATAVKVTGAAAHSRRVRSPVSDPLPPPVDTPSDLAGRVQDDVAASQPLNRRQAPAWSALRAVSFGAAGAMLGAAACATVVILTQDELPSVALGAIVAFSVGLAGAAHRRLWVGGISVVLTLLSLLLSEYVIARQFGGLTHAPLVLSPTETVTLIHDDLALNAVGLWTWAIALLFACGTPALSRSRIETESAPNEDSESAGNEDSESARKPWRWISGRGAWLAAGTAFATGLVAVVVLAAVPLGPAIQDQAPAAQRDGAGQVPKATDVTFQDVMVGDCFNTTPNNSFVTLPEVPCLQPHDNEVFYIFTMGPGKYPGDGAVQTSADNTCGDRLSDYVGDSPSASLDYGSFVPDQLSWDSGERSVICDLTRSDGEKLNGTTRAPK
jgi:hypothetical protein